MASQILITVAIIGGINGLLALALVVAERFLANYGEVDISINQDEPLRVQGGASLLTTLNSQKIFLPSACGGRGTCGYCKCKVIDGAGPLLPTEEPMLNQEEIAEQIRLSCQIKVKQNLHIEIPEELFNIKEFSTEVVLIRDLTYDTKLVRLKLIEPDTISFVPGQYIQLQSQPYEKVKDKVSRAYSIASSRMETGTVDIMVRLIPEGICTTWVHCHLEEGQRVMFTGPMGDFRLHDGEGEIVMVAGGSGMAPMASLLSEIDEKKIDRKITYFFGAVTGRDLFYIDEMRAFEKRIPGFTFVPALSEPREEDAWEGETGLITAPLENHLKKNENSDTQGYLCGSPGMINACVNVFNKYGVTKNRIFYDPFA